MPSTWRTTAVTAAAIAPTVAGVVRAEDTGRPQVCELVFDRLTDPQIQPAAVARIRQDARAWIQYDDGARLGPVDVRTTTGHNAFMTQPVGKVVLDRETHEFTVRVDPDAYQNVNLDRIDVERIGSR